MPPHHDETISTSDYIIRVASVRASLKTSNLLGLVAFEADVYFFTPFRSFYDVVEATVFIPADSRTQSMLFVSEQCLEYAMDVTGALHACDFADMDGRLGAFAAWCREECLDGGIVGLAREKDIPDDLLDAVTRGLAKTIQIKPSSVFAEIRAVHSDRKMEL